MKTTQHIATSTILSVCVLSGSITLANCKKNPPPQNTTQQPTTPTTTPTPGTPSTPTANNQGNPPTPNPTPTPTPTPAATPTFPPGACPATMPAAAIAALGATAGTEHTEISASQTWTAASSPHRIPSGLTIPDNVTITLEPCALVMLGMESHLNVDAGGALVSVGDQQHPIRITSTSATPQPGDYRGIFLHENARATSRFVYTTIEYGGKDSAEEFNGCLQTWIPNHDLQHVTLRNCSGFGLVLNHPATLASTSVDLTITGTVQGTDPFAGVIASQHPNGIIGLPTGSYTNNVNNDVLLSPGGRQFTTTGTLTNVGLRYRLIDNTNVSVEGPNSPVLTIAPGVTIAFGQQSALSVGWDAEGGLIADGTADQTRITFTTSSSEPGPGKWKGLFFGERMLRARSRLNYVNIQYAGGEDSTGTRCGWTGGDANIRRAMLYLQSQPEPTFLQHTRFVGMLPNATNIARNWIGPAVNFTDPTLANDFSQATTTCHMSPVQTSSESGCGDESTLRCN